METLGLLTWEHEQPAVRHAPVLHDMAEGYAIQIICLLLNCCHSNHAASSMCWARMKVLNLGT